MKFLNFNMQSVHLLKEIYFFSFLYCKDFMALVRQIIEWMRNLLNTDVGIVIAFITTVIWMISSTLAIIKFIKSRYNSSMGFGIIILLLLLGLVFPILILLSSTWSRWIHVILNILAIFGLFNFIGLLYIIKVMSISTKEKTITNT